MAWLPANEFRRRHERVIGAFTIATLALEDLMEAMRHRSELADDTADAIRLLGLWDGCSVEMPAGRGIRAAVGVALGVTRVIEQGQD